MDETRIIMIQGIFFSCDLEDEIEISDSLYSVLLAQEDGEWHGLMRSVHGVSSLSEIKVADREISFKHLAPQKEEYQGSLILKNEGQDWGGEGNIGEMAVETNCIVVERGELFMHRLTRIQ